MKERACYNCMHFPFCFIPHEIDKTIRGVGFLNIDGNAAPGYIVDIFISVGNCCIKFKSNED